MSKATRTINYCKALKAQLKKLGQSIPEFPSLKEEILSKYDSVNNLIDRAKKSQDWEAQSCLSKAYEYGIPELNIEQDLDCAIGWFEASLRNGNDINSEKCHLGALYDTRGTIPDQRRAFELYLESALEGVVQAQVNVAEVYRCGIEGVVYKDLEEAFKWYRKAAGEEYDIGNEIDSPVKGTLKDLGIDSKMDALKKLNKFYMIGDCPEGKPQPIKALYYLKKAAELGDSEAQKNLGLAYLKGESGQPKDLEKAKRWLKKAVSNGDQEAEEIIKTFGDETIEKVAPEQDEFLRENNAKQYYELLKVTMEQRGQLHPYVNTGYPHDVRKETFEQFPKSPTAQRFKEAHKLLNKGMENLLNWIENDENRNTDNLDFNEGIRMLALGMLYENSIVVSFLQSMLPTAYTSLIQDSIFNKLKTNPNFFEGLVVLFATYPFNRRFSAESCKMDLRRTTFLNNIIHLIKKAEPNMSPTQDPYSFEHNYSSWLHHLYYFLGSNYIIAHCYKDGADIFQKALECCPTFAEAKLPLGSCLLEMSLKKESAHNICAGKKQHVEDNPDELLLERFAKPNFSRITKGDYRTWPVNKLRETAKQLIVEYLTEVPECDKMYPEGYYNLAYLSFQEYNVEEASKWKDKGEEAEEKRLPFLPPFDSAIKEQYLRVLDFFPLSKKHNKKQTTRSSSSAGRNQDHATGNNNERETKTCTKCKKMLQEMKWCPCKKAFYCGSECQKEDWKEHKRMCTAKKKK